MLRETCGGKLKPCDFTGLALVKSHKKNVTNVVAFDMPDAVNARLETADNILVITARGDVVHLG